ncbi:MAG: type II toxin-antitoxin system Phd/YefM family antitoxin [Methylocystis sp.]|jgi:prevent-host-death family protein|nr:type II toxin-antitoxin system Phd/YefM family antitoxin [Methylocystis sp.]MCA3587448.1 type II toxin-antitoxin system Phd/YefM family antitoxin [Methylocystis sp.]MCA3591061.1 type II toxin-antitoxin system Phd/YefM family antitoxin [Methylocystis sp.]
MNITEDISPLTQFKRESARMIARIKETGRPQILTVNGKPSVVVMDASAWQDMQNQLDYAETVAGIRKGLTQARAGEGIPSSGVEAAQGSALIRAGCVHG